jgi:alpha-galactosidase
MTERIDAVTQLAPVPPWDEGEPRLHAPPAFGAGVGSPFFLPIPATGERPLAFSAEGLPEGLSLDSESGVIQGRVADAAEAEVTVAASNAHGRDARALRIVVGGRLALTPPLGWNSWNCWGATVDDAKVRAAAETMVAAGMAAYGYTYVNIDDGWQGERGGPHNALRPNEKFPDMKALCEAVHAMGLRIGIYSTPFRKSYAGYTGGSDGGASEAGSRQAEERGLTVGARTFETEDAAQWAEWGMDFLKYDWHPLDAPNVQRMSEALRACGRDIVYSLSNSGVYENAERYADLAHLWRTTGDITDRWDSVSRIGFGQDPWTRYGGPGHWNDPDMLVVGRLGWGTVRENRLTTDEKITHMTLWALLAAPLLAGCDPARMEDETLRLLGNDEVRAVDQDPAGRQGHCLREVRETNPNGDVTRHEAVYVRRLHDGSLALGLFNRAPHAARLAVAWPDLGIEGLRRVRDLWGKRDLGRFVERFEIAVPSHGAQFVRVSREI